jgi:hypothetical protein
MRTFFVMGALGRTISKRAMQVQRERRQSLTAVSQNFRESDRVRREPRAEGEKEIQT